MFEENTWVYFSAIPVCAICWVIMNALKYEYSIVDLTADVKLKRNKRIYLLYFHGFLRADDRADGDPFRILTEAV